MVLSAFCPIHVEPSGEREAAETACMVVSLMTCTCTGTPNSQTRIVLSSDDVMNFLPSSKNVIELMASRW